ncbi:hypothetical protein pEaSNUABM42_00167 [Erwinia phage pEa_SNUABM_42]|nr:hypothetical protein pEaSNUABM43_00167 [Erwinia phage pEa_SNUABM_43]QVW55484.1 hypothetical protein pEaSNUABM42_00167 [Erwinia phage pEa_SNUABM_42]
MAKTLQEEFIDMVNAKNAGLGLTLADVDFSDPSDYVPGEEGGTRNSVLTLTAKATSATFKGSKAYHFNRFNFTHPNGEDEVSVMMSDLDLYWQEDDYVLAQFNKALPNHPVTMSEVTITRTTVDGHLRVKIKIVPTHLKWQGAYVFEIYDGKTLLDNRDGELDGFN